MLTFKVGDYVVPSTTYNEVYLKSHRRIQWDRNQKVQIVKIWPSEEGEWLVSLSVDGEVREGQFFAHRFTLAGPPLTKEEQLTKKIDQLWKRQNYYKEYCNVST